MKIVSLNDKTTKVGKIALLYGETGTGKTVTSMQTLPGRVLVITCEERDLRMSVEPAGRKLLDIDEAKYTNWTELMELLADPATSKGVDNIILDGLTQLITGNIQFELVSEISEARKAKKDEDILKPLTNESKMTMESYGTLAFQMKRMMNLLCRHAKNAGKNIIITSLLQEHPKWNMVLSAAPSLAGKEFPKVVSGLCDYVGMLERRYVDITDANGNVIGTKIQFPPTVKFEPLMGEQFECKWTGPRISGRDAMIFPLDWSKIFNKVDESILAMREETPTVATAKDKK